jgi:hypothetical protein
VHLIIHQKVNYKIMTRSNTIILAAIGGAAVAAVLANFLTTEKGKELLNTAADVVKELPQKAAEYAKQNVGSAVAEGAKTVVAGAVKEKAEQKVSQ